MKIAIIGSSGYIGGHLYNFFKERALNHNIIGTYFNNPTNNYEFVHLDASDLLSVDRFVREHKPDLIILAAGNKNVKKCENDYSVAYNDNVIPVYNFIETISKNNPSLKLIYFSSDYVFNGEKGNYKDSDIPNNAKTNYGKSKIEAENKLIKSGINYKIIRTSAVIGNGSVFFDWLISSINNNEKINLYSNLFFTPTPINFLCEMAIKLILQFDDLNVKILHIVGENKYSRYEFGEVCRKILGALSYSFISEKANIAKTFFSSDTSLLQSDFIKTNQDHEFNYYLTRILNDKINRELF